jgi:CBS domain-containing protein
MKAKDVMTHCVVSIPPEAPILDAIARMLSHQVSGMPVINAQGQLVGMVTEGDFVRRAEIHTEAPERRWIELLLGPASSADDYARSHGRTVRDVMSPHVITVGEESPLAEVVRLMEEHSVKRMPVVDGDRVVGIVSRADLMVALAESLRESKHAPERDESIRESIVTEMKRQTWCPLHAIKVTVRNGVVDIRGEIFDERQRRAVRVLIENCKGVRTLHDHLALIESPSPTAQHARQTSDTAQAARTSHGVLPYEYAGEKLP